MPDLRQDAAERYTHLNYVLEKSGAYVKMLKERMDFVKARPRAPAEDTPSGAGSKRRRTKEDASMSKRRRTEDEHGVATEEAEGSALRERFVQPQLITGAKMKDYQLEGVAWLVALYENGISGILG